MPGWLTWIGLCHVCPRSSEYETYVFWVSVHACHRLPAESSTIGAKKFPTAPGPGSFVQVTPPSEDLRVPPETGTKISPLLGSTAKRPMQLPPMLPAGLLRGSGGT